MSARVQGELAARPRVIELPPEKEVAKAVTSKVIKPSRDQIEQFRATENDARAGTFGRALEGYFGGLLATIPEGDERKLELSVEGGEEVVGSGKVKLAVAREEGHYVVTLEGAAAAGVGEESKGLKATLKGGVTGSATFRFGSREEAADALSALVQAAPETGVAGAGGVLIGRLVRDDDALSRARNAASRLQSVEIGAQLSAELAGSSGLGERAAEFNVGGTVTPGHAKLDLAKGELVVSASVEAGADVSLSRELGDGRGKASGALAEGKVTVSLEQHFPLSLQDIERVQQGGMEALKRVAADSARHSRTEAVVHAEGNVAGLEIEAERRGPPSQLLQEVAEGRVLQSGQWSFQSFKMGGEASAEFDAGVLKVKGTVKDRLTLVTGKGELAPFLERTEAHAQEAHQQDRLLSVQRALSAR